MPFNPNEWANKMADYSANHDGQPYNDTIGMTLIDGKTPAPVIITPAAVSANQPYWRCVGVHHLTPEENRGGHSVYITALLPDRQRPRPCWAGWTWEGRQPNERADPVNLDKPPNEAGGNIAYHFGQIVETWILGGSPTAGELSDHARNLRTDHPDERGPGGEIWNSVGHHSFYVVFQRAVGGPTPQPEPEPEPEPEPPPTPGPEFKTWTIPLGAVGAEIAVALSIKVKRW